MEKSKAHKEVENLHSQKNKIEEDLYRSHDAKERLVQILKKADTKYIEMTTRAAKAEDRVTHLQEIWIV